jgi:ketosteroid isomerase-like protein
MNTVEGSAHAIAMEWLAEMQACVRTVDFARCRAIFADDVVGFGTKAAIAVGLDSLEREQWRHIWGTIRSFTFVTTELHCARYGEEAIWLGCPWTSEAPAPDGAWRHRPGRITAVLEWRDGQWLAVHTHHSVVPESTALPSQFAHS